MNSGNDNLKKNMHRSLPVLWIVIPCYNEQEVLPITAPMFLEKIIQLQQDGLIDKESRILFVNDGSKDRTWEIISELAEKDSRFLGISQSRNRGHQNALVAGMMEAADRCDITITIDCDGQDDLNAMDEMVDRYLDGCEIVYGVRSDRDTDTWFKRTTAQGYYKVLGSLGAEVVYNHADYRLLSRRALQALLSFGEVNMFLRGMVPMLGFNTAQVYYERGERVAGESKYPFRKMVAFAMEGITSLSNKPIRYILLLGALCALLGVAMAIYVIVSLARGNTVAGWASTMMSIWLLGGLQLMSLGLIGEYVGKIYMETKRRPKFILEEHLH
jgi:glycosyltransferase involved in cell wall biosynthesis